MSRKYKFSVNDKLYCISFAVVYWVLDCYVYQKGVQRHFD